MLFLRILPLWNGKILQIQHFVCLLSSLFPWNSPINNWGLWLWKKKKVKVNLLSRVALGHLMDCVINQSWGMSSEKNNPLQFSFLHRSTQELRLTRLVWGQLWVMGRGCFHKPTHKRLLEVFACVCGTESLRYRVSHVKDVWMKMRSSG